MTTPSILTTSLPPIEAFQQAARRYVWSRGWRGADADDFVSEMVLEALEQPDTAKRMQYFYLHALDRQHPRSTLVPGRREQRGQRVRPSQRTLSLDTPGETDADARPLLERLPAPPPPDVAPWAPAVLARLLRRLPPTAALVLRAYYLEGLTELALGRRLGVTESRACQLLRKAQAQLIYAAHLNRRRHGAH